MKIKTDFITNSSSTSFILITKNGLTEDDFLKLLGIKRKSPFLQIFHELFNNITEEMTPLKGSALEIEISKSPDNVANKLENAKNNHQEIFTGSFNSDDPIVKSFFCTESFEAEDDKFYFNYLENYW